ncbi:transcription factor iiia protein, putative [Rhizoctonia solani AG-3 Rhs1AP]|uniref:Transcription factor iiia protein, putative n=1 Tax=Rhizoctonia solani AG-3 Rhs1AP TaxID=1086054 RepID=X8J4B3_9AGAM|nr:transcription factor iiia protein, putative [Rhizoctonia solani AG-3 Rhs1AP]
MPPISAAKVLTSGVFLNSHLQQPSKQTLATRLRASSYSSDSEKSSFIGSESESEVSESDDAMLAEKTSPPLQGTSRTRSQSIIQTTSKHAPLASASKAYACSHAGCGKIYRKPSRLQEHERSHTGERPFVCSECGKSYLRDSHLRAHSRSHLPASARPFVCTYKVVVVGPQSPRSELIPTQHTNRMGSSATTQSQLCGQRFWTAQHLRSHESVIHHGEKPYKCTLCPFAFSKHGALRLHMADSHAPPGTKPYRCENAGCTQSFPTNQKLKTHARVHDDARYACVHPNCSKNTGTIVQFPTWSLLQEHMRSVHPPTCPYPACNGRTFTFAKGLRGHIKTHRDRELEAEYTVGSEVLHKRTYTEVDPVSENSGPPPKRRRGGEVGRDWPCLTENCVKTFKSKKAQQDHVRVSHEGLRRFACPNNGCNKTFGYKHVMQRHLERHHRPQDNEVIPQQSASTNQKEATEKEQIINLITGQDYDASPRSLKTGAARPRAIHCPWPNAFEMRKSSDKEHAFPLAGTQDQCAFRFKRAYDLRRHLRSAHGLDVNADEVGAWVLEHKRFNSSDKTN